MNEEESLLKKQNSSTNDHPQKRVVIITTPIQSQDVKKQRMETDALQIMKEPYKPKSKVSQNQNQNQNEKKPSNEPKKNQVTQRCSLTSIQGEVIENLIASRKINSSYSYSYSVPSQSIGQMNTNSSTHEFNNNLDEPSLNLENYTTEGFSNGNNNMDFMIENTSCCSMCNLKKKKSHSSSDSAEIKEDNQNDTETTKSTDLSNTNSSANRQDHNLTSELLPQVDIEDMDKLCLVVDLDETLVHSSTQPNGNYDLRLTLHNPCVDPKRKDNSGSLVTVYVNFRPGAEEFIANLAPLYEMVFFTTSGKEYADLVIDKLDPCHMVKHRLFRENCTELGGNFVKDLSRMNRDLDRIIIIDNNPISYMLQPGNAIAISSWFEDPKDKELSILQQFLIRNASAQSISEIFR